jgi:hypothetical protein
MTQIQLSDTQAVILTAACARDDQLVFPVTTKLKGGAVGNVLKSLLKRWLIEEIPAADRNTVWRHDEATGAITLRATALARSALGVHEDDKEAAPEEPPAPSEAAAAPVAERRKGGKQALLIEMLRRPVGASLVVLVAATGWQPHTVRGAIAGALKKKLGLTVTSEKVENRGRVYRIV